MGQRYGSNGYFVPTQLFARPFLLPQSTLGSTSRFDKFPKRHTAYDSIPRCEIGGKTWKFWSFSMSGLNTMRSSNLKVCEGISHFANASRCLCVKLGPFWIAWRVRHEDQRILVPAWGDLCKQHVSRPHV